MGGLIDFTFNVLYCIVFLVTDLLCMVFRCFVPLKKSLKDDVILVTGAASGLGRLMSYKLVSLKPRMIVCWDMNAVENQKTSENIMKMYPGVQSLHFQVDLSNKVKTAEVAAQTKD